MDADLSDRSINYCKKAMKINRCSYYILKNNMMAFSNYTIKYTVYDNWIIQIIHKLKNNKKLVFQWLQIIKPKI